MSCSGVVQGPIRRASAMPTFSQQVCLPLQVRLLHSQARVRLLSTTPRRKSSALSSACNSSPSLCRTLMVNRQMVMIIRIDGDGNTNGASSQVFILDALAAYRCQTTKEAENIAERVMPRLQHVNSAVVLSAIKVLGACAALRVYACFGASVRAVKKKDRLVLAAIPAPSIEYIAGACCWKSSCDAAAAADDHVLMTLMLPAVAHAVDDNNVLALDAMRGNAGSQAVVLFHLMDYINEGNPAYEDTVKLWCKKMAPPLVTLLGSEPEVLKHMRSFTLLQAKTAHYSMLRPAALAVPLLLPHPHVGLRTGSIPSPCFAVSLLCIPLPYQH
eukprot:scaffold36942_cov17-Tisochrysis_lutea.AAC.1